MNSQRTLIYYPELNAITGSINATLLLCQLEYWFTKTSGKPFYKFLAPCEDECYRPGDSWCEELAFSKPEFRKAFSHIGQMYKSKKAYQASGDPFAGKLYLSYYDRIRRRTYYLRNHSLVDTLLGPTASAPTTSPRPCDTVSANTIMTHPAATSTSAMTVSQIDDVVLPTNAQSESPLAVDYSLDLHTQTTSEDDSSCQDSHQQVLSLYHEVCTDLPKVSVLTNAHRHRIDTLLDTLGGSLSQLRTLFEKAAASDFLCGRLPHSKWRALFDWLITSNNSLAILGGKYDNWATTAPTCTSTTISPTSATTKATRHNKFTTMYSHRWDLDKLEEMAYEHFLSLV
ncbi:MAG: hypothetical protein ACRCTE_02735 [Cellulosilyticaceae bacterium]